MSTHGQTLRTFATWSEVVGLHQGDRYLIVNPFFHTFGYKAGILACLMTGATMVPEPVFDVDRLMERIEAERITVLPGPPTIFQSILDHPERKRFDLSSLRLVVTGAAAVPVELVNALWSDLGIETVLTAYGLTEATGTVTMCRRGDAAEVISGTSGRAIPDVEVRIVDVDGEPSCPRGEAGEIVVRGLQRDAAGTSTIPRPPTRPSTSDGWLHTGDIGVMDDGRQRGHHRPAEGHVRERRVQRLSGRGRGRPSESPRSGPGRGGRGARPPHWAKSVWRSWCRPVDRGERDGPRGRVDPVGQGAPGQLQGAEAGGGGRRAAGQCQRQGARSASFASSTPTA